MDLKPSLGYIRDTGTAKGRGVFASCTLAEGDVIEVCPVVQLKTSYSLLPEELQKVVFHWGVLAGMNGVSAVALGYGGMYNHANPANSRYKASPDGLNLVFVAAVAIRQDEEITINYNATAGEPMSSEDNWFEQTGVTPFDAGPTS
ncbi:hypothetical protein SNE35_08120 [Paucibacter sp. R3-3]|uniref:SET domain-containing protein n=1 Tax=Roseateles agri TaxID=3098619 RepID=A0ABU5DFB8_9BURK|nr:SET domain-containing protein-lysine N-methyltransferase [Paucibacter sp. R3-3]MDY0744468.1 hypothetical protein [Paucibacter sp. R3-3]